jgi:N-methylhydantoinase B
LWSIGGASRCIDFDPTPGLLSCADYPASMSCGGTIGAYAAIVLANNCLAKMMACSGNADLQMDIMANEANSMWPITQLSGIDSRGESSGSAILDPMIGGLGAFTFRDGIDTGGMYLVPKGKAANVEQNELHFPVLYLYRKELMDSGGVGEYRGGNSGELAFIPHKTEHITQDTATSGAAVPTGMGLFGGGPGCTNEYLMIYESDIRRRFEKGDCVNSWEELVGNVQVLPPKKAGIEQRADDVYVIHWSAGAGIGDPLLRPIDKVEEDVKQGHISIACAQSQYGVVFEQRGAYLKRVSNEEERKRLLESRLAQATLPALTNNRKVDVGRCVRVYRSLAIEKSKSIWVCGEVLGSLVAGYKAGCAILESKLSDIQPLVKDPRIMVDRSLVARQFLCPSCGVRIEIELVREGDQQIYDMEIVGS